MTKNHCMFTLVLALASFGLHILGCYARQVTSALYSSGIQHFSLCLHPTRLLSGIQMRIPRTRNLQLASLLFENLSTIERENVSTAWLRVTAIFQQIRLLASVGQSSLLYLENMNGSPFINEYYLENMAKWTDDHISKTWITTNEIPRFVAKSLFPMYLISEPVSSSTK